MIHQPRRLARQGRTSLVRLYARSWSSISAALLLFLSLIIFFTVVRAFTVLSPTVSLTGIFSCVMRILKFLSLGTFIHLSLVSSAGVRGMEAFQT